MVQWIRSLSLIYIKKENSLVQIQPVPLNIFSEIKGFFIFLYSVRQGNNFLAGYFYIFELFFYSGIFAGTAAFPSNKKEEFTCYIHEYVAKVEPISSLLMHNLLEILHTL